MALDLEKTVGSWGSDAFNASVKGTPLRTSFLDENDFNRYYGIDGATTQWAKTTAPVAGEMGLYNVGWSTDSATGGYAPVKAPVWSDSMLIQATPAPAAAPPPASSAPPPPPGGANAVPTPAPQTPGTTTQPKAAPEVPQYKAQIQSMPKPGEAGYEAVTYTPEEWQAILASVDPTTDTVRGQMEGLLAENSKYMQLARQGALTTANSRGLLNSSIAAGAGEKAAIESSLPIANADAQIYSQQRLANQTVQNQAGQFNAAEANKALALKANATNALTQAGYQAMLTDIAAGNQAERTKEQMSFDEGIKTRLTALQQDYAIELETLKQTYQISQNRDTVVGQMYSDLEKSLATFLNRA